MGNIHILAPNAVNKYTNASDDREHILKGALAHPENLKVSWGVKIAEVMKMNYQIIDPSDTNESILESAMKWSSEIDNDDYFVIIGWADNNPQPIIGMHLNLKEKGIQHLFFNTSEKVNTGYDFGINLVEEAFIPYLKEKGYDTVIMSDNYFGPDAHSEWMKYLINHIASNRMI